MDSSSCDILEKMINREKKITGMSFVAPVVRGNKVRVRVGLYTWECHLDKEFSGWGVFEMVAPGKAKLLREAEFWEKEEYLETFPKITLILFYLDSEGTWWAKDFKHNRFVPVHLVEGHMQFDVVAVSFDGASYWYVSPEPGSDAKKAQALRDALKNKISPNKLKIFSLTSKEAYLYEIAFIINTEVNEGHKDEFVRKVEQALQMGNAELLECTEVNNGYRVKWRRGHQTLTSVVDRDLTVINAGLCLSGQDKYQDLTSLASLIVSKPAGTPYVGYVNEEGYYISEEQYHQAHPPIG